MPTSGGINPRVRAWLLARSDVLQRIDAAEALGLDLSIFRVTCWTCNSGWYMTAEQLLRHIEAHYIGARTVAA